MIETFSITPFLLLALVGLVVLSVRRARFANSWDAGIERDFVMLCSVVLGWAVFISALASFGFLKSDAFYWSFPAFWMPFVVPILVAVGIFAMPNLRSNIFKLLDKTPNWWLVAIQGLRWLAIGALIKASLGAFPGVYAWLVGIPDMLFGLSALVVAYLVYKQALNRWAVLSWQVAGILIVLLPSPWIIQMGLPGPVYLLQGPPNAEILFNYPLILGPVVILPLLLILAVWQIAHIIARPDWQTMTPQLLKIDKAVVEDASPEAPDAAEAKPLVADKPAALKVASPSASKQDSPSKLPPLPFSSKASDDKPSAELPKVETPKEEEASKPKDAPKPVDLHPFGAPLEVRKPGAGDKSAEKDDTDVLDLGAPPPMPSKSDTDKKQTPPAMEASATKSDRKVLDLAENATADTAAKPVAAEAVEAAPANEAKAPRKRQYILLSSTDEPKSAVPSAEKTAEKPSAAPSSFTASQPQGQKSSDLLKRLRRTIEGSS